MSGAPSLLPPDPPDPNRPPQPRDTAPSQINCRFCQCVLTPSGDYISLSERARELRDQGETISDLQADLAAKDGEITELNRLLDEAKSKIRALETPTAKKSLW